MSNVQEVVQEVALEQYGVHWALRIGGIVYEYCGTDGPWSEGEVSYTKSATDLPFDDKTPDSTIQLGTTSWTVEKLQDFCKDYQKHYPTYHLTTCNCQNFVERLCDELGYTDKLPWKIMTWVDQGRNAVGVIGGVALGVRGAAATATAGELLLAGSVGAATGVGVAFVAGTAICWAIAPLLQGSSDSSKASSGSSKGVTVYYMGSKQTFDSGDKLVYGLEGEIIGPSTQKDDSQVSVRFVGHKRSKSINGKELSYTAPPALPGGWKVGDSVYYISSKKTYPSGDKLIYGMEGEVMGPSKYGNDGVKVQISQEGVQVKFAGNKCVKDMWLSKLSSAAPPALPGGLKVEDPVYYIGTKQTWKTQSGDEMIYGMKGEVMGPSNNGNDGVEVQFAGHKRLKDMSPSKLSSAEPPKIEDNMYYIIISLLLLFAGIFFKSFFKF